MTVVSLQESVKDKKIRELQEKLVEYQKEEKLEEYAAQISQATNAILVTWLRARSMEDFDQMCAEPDQLIEKLQPFLKDENENN